MIRLLFSLLVVALVAPAAESFSAVSTSRGISHPPAVAVPIPAQQQQQQPLQLSSVVSTVAVTGATGRTGQLVVQLLLDRGVQQVVALVRDPAKAQRIFSSSSSSSSASQPVLPPNLQIIQCDLGNEQQIAAALESADAAIWCATGFSNTPPDTSTTTTTNPWTAAVQRLFGVVTPPPQQPKQRVPIDAIGLPAVAKALARNAERRRQQPEQQQPNGGASASDNNPAPLLVLPQVVMCSAAGVTRPTWSTGKKEALLGAADIPIVRLNPFGILDVKRDSEIALRATCINNDNKIPYCIVRPVGLNDEQHPAGGRPVLTQGDVAVGRIHRQDVAALLVNVLTEPHAVDKTFEVFTLGAGSYPVGAAGSLSAALARLEKDSCYKEDEAVVTATYHVLQQLLPGQEQKSAALAMGQSYEQYDRGETGRLGPRGQENAVEAAPKPTG